MSACMNVVVSGLICESSQYYGLDCLLRVMTIEINSALEYFIV
jgi:hypothetical protein